jgi:hypothetical protein
MNLPIDSTKVRFVASGPAEPYLRYGTGEQRVNRDGVALYQLRVVAMTEAGAEVLTVIVPGEPKGIRPQLAVRIAELEVRPWTSKDKTSSGIAYEATSIEPEGAPRS